MTKTKSGFRDFQTRALFEFWSLGFVSDFGFRASDLELFVKKPAQLESE
jgi:hypothetical protein